MFLCWQPNSAPSASVEQQVIRTDIECRTEPQQRRQTNLALAALDSTDLDSCETRPMRKVLLCPASLAAGFADVRAESVDRGLTHPADARRAEPNGLEPKR